jgi:hypothetical protein
MRNPLPSKSGTTLEGLKRACRKVIHSMPTVAVMMFVAVTPVTAPVLAQTTTGTISGSVVDPGGALSLM